MSAAHLRSTANFSAFKIIFRQLRISWCGAPSLTSDWACTSISQAFLGLASTVVLEPESLGTRNHICFCNTILLVTNQNLIQDEIKRRLNSGNACYHSVQNLLSSRLLSENLKIMYVLLYGCETCSLTVKEVHRLGVFENRTLKRIFEPRSMR
jgi:hypothetical protein